jgi:hypothetical protein
LYAIFFRFDGLISAIPLERDKTVTSQWYTDVCLGKVFDSLKEKRSVKGHEELFILHDNARPHVSQHTREFLNENRVKLISHPPIRQTYLHVISGCLDF